MAFITQIFSIPLGWIMYAFYSLTNDYLVSLLLLTLLTRVAMLPTTIKQQKSTVKMNLIRPQLEEIQKKYANNKEKLNEETMKLYSRENFNPMSGCLPLLITMPILFGLIGVVYNPLTHLLRLSKDVVSVGTAVVTNEANAHIFGNLTDGAYQVQLQIIRGVREMPELFAGMGQEAIDAINSINLNYFGMDFTGTPSWGVFTQIFSDFNPIIFIPIFAGATSFLVSLLSMRNSASAGSNQMAGSMKSMMLMMPIFSLWFSMQVPAGVGIYWCFSNVFAIAQTLVMNKVYNPKEMAEKAKAEAEERKERERLERIEAKKNDPNKGLSQKEINRRKLAEARRKHAERYGDEFAEVTDEDLKA